jgi:ferredoxin
MKLSFLKKLRVFISILFFLLTALLFLDFTGTLSTALFNSVTYLEFLPSLLKFINLLAFSSAGFLLILLLTFFFGRVYCSTVCPMGTLQDVISFFSKKFNKKKKFKHSRPYNVLRYSILAVSVIALLAGSIILFNILDPYSNFGRITAQIFKPAVILVNNIAALIAEKLKLYWIYPADIRGFRITSLILPVLMLGLVGYLSYTKGRLYCNTVCPVGSFLGLVSRFSLFKIEIDRAACENCGHCGTVCKASCIDVKNKSVDFTRCVSCFNCFEICPTLGMRYKFRYTKAVPGLSPEDENDRRKFLLSTSAYLLGYAGLSFGQNKIKVYTMNSVPVIKKSAVSPPGSQSIERFNRICTACNLCVSACPTQVLQPSFLEYGVMGMFQPHFDNSSGYCNFDCTKCGEVCPTGAILPLKIEVKKLTQIGRAHFIKENCVVETQKSDCGACSEHCPTKAVHMIPYNGLFLPEVREEFCVGCGACEHACPTMPYKAIYVEGNPVHKQAEKPKEEKIEKKVDYKEEFPF